VLLEDGDAAVVLALVSPELGRGPLSVVVRGVPWERVRAGEAVRVAPGELAVGPVRVATARAAAWNPQVPRVSLPASVLEACVRWLVRAAPAESLASILPSMLDGAPAGGLLPWQRRALEGARALASGELAAGSSMLCGLGPGLTPSGDDFLCGWMLAVHVRGRDPGPIAQHARSTHRIARAYLEAAARGHASEAWHRFLRAAAAGVWQASARSVLRAGETSGADTLAGFLAALR
jgi:hypothetical protein